MTVKGGNDGDDEPEEMNRSAREDILVSDEVI